MTSGERQTGEVWRLIQSWLDGRDAPYARSQRKIAEALDVSPQTITNWKYGSGAIPAASVREQLAAKIKRTPAEVLAAFVADRDARSETTADPDEAAILRSDLPPAVKERVLRAMAGERRAADKWEQVPEYPYLVEEAAREQPQKAVVWHATGSGKSHALAMLALASGRHAIILETKSPRTGVTEDQVRQQLESYLDAYRGVVTDVRWKPDAELLQAEADDAADIVDWSELEEYLAQHSA